MQKRTPHRSDAGVALFVALVLLLVFTMLGTAYVRFMNTSLDMTRLDIQKLRGNHLGKSGVYAAIGEIEVAMASGNVPAGEYDFPLPLYRTEMSPDGDGLTRGEYPQQVKATVFDESGLVNLNHAPDEVLAALDIPAEVIAARKASGFQPFVSVDDLRSRDYMNSQQFNALDKSVFTVYTSEDGGSNLNLNTASPKVLAALFGIDEVEASSLASKRPFTSWRDFLQNIGREPSTFRIASSSGNSLPEGISLTSNCFRILSTASMVTPDTSQNGVQVDVEAVVYFGGEGFAIRYWTENPAVVTFTRDSLNAEEMLAEPVDKEPATEESDADDETLDGESEESADDSEESAESV